MIYGKVYGSLGGVPISRLVGILDMSMQMTGQLPPGMRPRGEH